MNLDHLPKAPGIYAWTHTPTGRKYVGQAKDIRARQQGHLGKAHRGTGVYLHAAMRKHGVEAFEITVLELCPVEQLGEREVYWIAELNSLKPGGYNLTRGGEDSPMNHPETRAKVSATMRATYVSLEARANLRALLESPEVMAKLSAASDAQWASPEARTKQSATMRAVRARPDVKAKMRAVLASPDVKAKLSAAARAMWARRKAAENFT